MTDEERELLKAKVAGRDAAYELADLYISQSANLMRAHGKHGAVASIEFFETLRDSLVAIRPFQPVAPKPDKSAAKSAPDRLSAMLPNGEWKEWKVPDSFVLLDLDERVTAVTEQAVKIGESWFPKSVLYEVPQKGQAIKSWPVAKWFARKEGLIDE